MRELIFHSVKLTQIIKEFFLYKLNFLGLTDLVLGKL